MACLVLREFFTTDYRGIVGILEDSSDLKKILELKEIPHFTTLQKAAQRLLKKKIMRKLIKSILMIASKEKIIEPIVQLAAVDGTGFESHPCVTLLRKASQQEQPITVPKDNLYSLS